MESEIIEMIDKISESNWQQQINIIQQLSVCPTLVKLINHRNYCLHFVALFTNQFNPRSKLITTLCQFLIELFTNHCNSLITFANKLMSHECLLKLLGNGNKIISSSINELCKTIILHTNYSNQPKNIQFVHHLQNQFINSKNNYVKQQISMYFLVIYQNQYYLHREDAFYKKILALGEHDSNETVRKNIKEIISMYKNQELQRANHQQEDKYNLVSYSRSKNINKTGTNRIRSNSTSKSKLSLKNELQVNNNILNKIQAMPSILSKIESNLAQLQQKVQFCLDRISGDQPWHIKQSSFKQICELILDQNSQILQPNKQLSFIIYENLLEALIPFLQEKRNKLYEVTAQCILKLIDFLARIYRPSLMTTLQKKYMIMGIYIVKHEELAQHFISKILNLSPLPFIPMSFSLATQIKNYQQKFNLLTILSSNIHLLAFNQKLNSKIKIMIKELCSIIQDNHDFKKQKQLCCQECVRIISKLEHHGWKNVVVETMIGLQNKILKKVITLAEQVDCKGLKQNILKYIHSLKDEQKQNVPSINNIIKNNESNLHSQIARIRSGSSKSLQNLAQIIFCNHKYLTNKDFQSIFILCNSLLEQDILLEYRILLEQLSKIANKKYIESLLWIISNKQNEKQIHTTHKMMFLQVLEQAIGSYLQSINQKAGIDAFSLLIVSEIIKIYRQAKGQVKIRQKCIRCLCLFKNKTISQCVNEKEMSLIVAYKQKDKVEINKQN